MNLICMPNIDTKNATTAFEKVGLNCSSQEQQEGSASEWSKKYHPSFIISSNQCVGFKGVPERVECAVDNFPTENVRRLCNCQNSSKF